MLVESWTLSEGYLFQGYKRGVKQVDHFGLVAMPHRYTGHIRPFGHVEEETMHFGLR